MDDKSLKRDIDFIPDDAGSDLSFYHPIDSGVIVQIRYDNHYYYRKTLSDKIFTDRTKIS